MGLAASQARLLTITSRLHDVEYRQQNVANQKLRLSNESDAVSNKYSNALNTQRFTMKINGMNGSSTVTMNVKNLLSADSPYRLETKDGKRIMASDRSEYFNKACNSLIQMMKDCNKTYGTKNETKYSNDARYKQGYDWWQDCLKNNSVLGNQAASYAIMCQTGGKYSGYEEWGKAYGINKGVCPSLDEIIEAAKNKGVTISKDEHLKYYEEFKQIVAENASGNIKDNTFRINKEATSIDNSKLMEDPNWLYEMIESGELKLVTVAGADVSTSSATDVGTEYDKDVATRAEAEYKAETNKINRKEKMLDMESRNLDTEYSAMTTEFDSLKNLIKTNSDKSFNLFS